MRTDRYMLDEERVDSARAGLAMSETSLNEFLSQAQVETIAGLARPGDWLTALQRVEVWRQVRDAATNPLDSTRRAAISPFAVDGSHGPVGELSADAVEVVHRVSSDPGRLTRAWANDMMAGLGEETYTELVGVAAITMVLDRFALAVGADQPTPARPEGGEPVRNRPEGVGDVGAWVSQELVSQSANVSRTLSLVPNTNAIWRLLVDSHYSRGTEFFDLEWQRALTRPQVELVAARTTALNECFY